MFRLTASQPFGAAEHGRVRSNSSRQRSTLSRAGWSTIQPTSRTRSVLKLPTWEGLMVEICVTVEDATRVPRLVRRLANIFERSSISFDRSRNEVRVESEWESRAVMGVVEVVQAWLSENGAESATLSIGNSTYTLVAPASFVVIH
jgi:hypothetical protein